MIKAVFETGVGSALGFCRKHPLGMRISTPILTYGTGSGMISVFEQLCGDEITAIVARFARAVLICTGEQANGEELGAFVRSFGLPILGIDLDFEICGLEVSERKALFCLKFSTAEPEMLAADEGELSMAYDLIQSEIPSSFDAGEEARMSFISDYLHRSRHGLARMKIIEKGGRIAAVCFTAAEDSSRALISGVASDKSFRGMGYGKSVVLAMAKELQKDGLTPYVIALNASAEGFYEHLGFGKAGTVCRSDT